MQRSTFGRLKTVNLPGAAEGLVVAGQDQALRGLGIMNTTSYIVMSVPCTCHVCNAGLHLTAGCSVMVPTDCRYTDRYKSGRLHQHPLEHV